MKPCNGKLPEWAEVLEPVRYLPTNVGSRIRKRVYDALENSPPAWARKRLEHSISRQVYKGNASGPTKRAVVSVLEDVLHKQWNDDSSEITEKHKLSIPDITSKLCRTVLRRTASYFDSYCQDFPRSLIVSPLDDGERIFNSSASIFHYLDFRTIDCRLAVGAYRGSHEAFFRHVQELLDGIRTSLVGGSYMIQLADMFLQLFDLAYEKEVVDVVKKLNEYAKAKFVDEEASREVENTLISVSEIPRAPWNSGICKVCNIDKDDNLVLLCDICDGEYHTYCLERPLDKIPEDSWYCPLCISPETVAQTAARILDSHLLPKVEESETSDDALEYVTCKLCGDRSSSYDMLCCYKCEINFAHRSCYFGERKIPAEDVAWACGDCGEI